MADREVKSEEVLHKIYCRIRKAPPGAVEVEVELLQDAEQLISDLDADLVLAARRQASLEKERRRLKSAVRYRDRVIEDLRKR